MNQNARTGPGGTRGHNEYNYQPGEVKITHMTLPPQNRPETPIGLTFNIGDKVVEATCPTEELLNFVANRGWITHDETQPLAKTGT